MARHRWKQVDWHPFVRNPVMKCTRCGLEAQRSDVRHGGFGPCQPITCVVCGLPIVDEEEKKFAEDQEAHPGILGKVCRRCYNKECDEHPDLPWEDPISGEVDWEGMTEDLGVDTGYDEYDEYEDW